MKKVTVRRNRLSTAVLCIISGTMLTAGAQAQDSELIEEVVTLGQRGLPRTVSDSPVPVDVFNSEEIEAVSYTDTNNILQTLVPSYNVARQPISDGGTFIRPAQLRGMPTDKTLVLVNSKRRHRAALVSIGGSGTQGPDVATIPGAALKTVEVLRDGAAAQYGSDAIAGVINFVLKDNSEGGSLTIDTGEFTEGDGTQYTVQGNIGLPLGADGFLSLSGEYSKQDMTIRGEQYCESWFCLDPSNPTYDPSASYTTYTEDPTFMDAVAAMGEVVQPWGQPNAEAYRMFFNAGMPLTDDSEIYAFGNYSQSESDGAFFYRYPFNGTIEYLREEDGSLYWPLEKFPGGFTPRFEGEVIDYSMVTGIKGGDLSGLTYDISARFGHNEIKYTLGNTVNPSLGPDSPTKFKPGDLINEEIQIQGDFGYEFDLGLSSPMLFAFGFSYMDETYDVVEGEVASYEAGPYALQDPWGFCNDDGTPTATGASVIAGGSSLDCADSDDPVYQVVGVGSNGFPGYSPEFSDTYSRDSYAVYADLSANVTDALFLQGALRYEDYSDFGTEVVGKLAGKLDITETIGLRASAGTGFRAPTPGQQGTVNVSTRLPNGFPVATGLFPAGGPVAGALGAQPLKPETSTNYTFGITSSFDRLSLTLDFYRIELEDRTNAVSTLDVSTDPTSGSAFDNYQALVAAGVAGAESIGGVFYFANAFDTTTDGVDLVATYPVDWSNGTSTKFTVSMNYNTTEFDTDPSAYLNAENAYDFVNDTPEFRSVVSATHEMGPLTLVGRANYYGSNSNSNNNGSPLTYQYFSPIWQVDLEGSYDINDNLTLSLGGRNIFDEYPEMDSIGDFCCGRHYSSSTVVDWQGSYYYMKLNARF